MGVDGVDHIGPYRVVERLGIGGMGEVYKAYDDRLDRWVAIKRIRPDKEEAEEHRERFRREARAAARLNHTAIVHVYDIFHDGDSDCIVMELVEGRSLDQLIAEGPLDPYRAAELARQIAAGLAEAHDKRILHRDLKAENVIVTDGEQSKILDFGLAKPLIKGDLDTSLTGKGQVVGTSRAMSPEYVSGDEVDLRSDLFSLGVLLYEAVTGQSPFKAHNTLATLKRVILHRQTPAHEVNPAVPLPLSLLIDRLLEKEPEDRPQNAREVAEALSRIVGRSSSSDAHASLSSMTGALDLPGIDSPGAARRWRWLAFSLLALLIIAVAAGIWLRQDRPELDFESRDRVVLAEFVNNTGETELDNTLGEAFRTALAQSQFVNLLSPRQVLASLERMEAPGASVDRERGIEISKREGAKALVLGRIDKIGSGYNIVAEVVSPQREETLFLHREAATSQDDILAAIDKTAATIRAELGESLQKIEDTPVLEKVTTPNFEALRAYSLGFKEFNQDHQPQAITLLEHAIDLDPQFATAHAVLGTVYRNLNDLEKAALHFEQALKYSNRLTAVEKLYVKGVVATWLGGSPQEMLDAWTLLVNLYPDHVDGLHNLGVVRWLYFNEFEQAAQPLGRAVEISGSATATIVMNYGRVLTGLDRYDEAINQFQQIIRTESASIKNGLRRDQQPESDSVEDSAASAGRIASYKDTDLLSALADAHTAAKNLEQSSAVLYDNGMTAPGDLLAIGASLILFHLDQGQLQSALSLAEDNEERAEQQGFVVLEHDYRLSRLAILQALGATEDLNALLQEGVGRARLYIEQVDYGRPPIASVPLLAILGKFFVRYGDIPAAETILTEIQPLAERKGFKIWKAYYHLLDGEISHARGRLQEAASAFRASLEQVETTQAHESLARTLEEQSELDSAIVEYRWLANHRGRIFSECLQLSCFERSANLLIWISAKDKLSALEKRLELEPIN